MPAFPSAAATGRSRRCALVRPRCRREKEPLAFCEHRIKGTEIQTRMFQFKQARKFLAIIAVHLSILPSASDAADNLGILGAHPRWNVLEKYQETITHDEFTRLIQDAYCTHGFAPDLIEINEKTAQVLMNRETQKFFTLRFAENPATAGRQPVPRLWRPARSLPPLRPEKPLFGLKIALDPGHLGG